MCLKVTLFVCPRNAVFVAFYRPFSSPLYLELVRLSNQKLGKVA